jgi:hypothetical protein
MHCFGIAIAMVIFVFVAEAMAFHVAMAIGDWRLAMKVATWNSSLIIAHNPDARQTNYRRQTGDHEATWKSEICLRSAPAPAATRPGA